MVEGEGNGGIVEVDNPYDYEFFEDGPLTDEENEALERALARRCSRQLAQEAARQIGIIKAMRKHGLGPRRATITGVTVEFAQPEGTREVRTDDEVERWIAHQKARTDAR